MRGRVGLELGLELGFNGGARSRVGVRDARVFSLITIDQVGFA